MPLIPNQAGGLVLVCINGCEKPKTTKGLASLVHQADANGKIAVQLAGTTGQGRMPPYHTQSTMVAEKGWLTLIGVEPKMQPAPGMPVEWTQGPRLNFNRGQAVRSFTCSVCGYVEMYDATTIEPSTWGTGA